MKKLLLVFLILGFTLKCFAGQDIIADFNEQNIAILNEEIRKLNKLYSAQTAPASATYITQTANSGLSAEQALGSLSTGIMKVTTTTGAITSTTIDDWLPSQTGNSGKYLTTNGTNSSWGTVTGGTSSHQLFTSSGTFTAPTGVTKVYITMCGGGGGGGGAADANGFAGGGGGAVSVIKCPYTVVPENNYTVTINAGGAGGAAGDNNGAAGGNTSFNITLIAGGGGGGSKGSVHTGGTGGASTLNGDGQTAPGSPSMAGGNGGTGPGGGAGGVGGASLLGSGAPSAQGYAAGISATSPGGGGSGAATNAVGGNGATGVCLIEW